MKKHLLALSLCAALLLSGCSAMLERGHETITTHVDYAVAEDESILRAETYQGLVNAMLYFVNGHRTTGTIRLYNYTGDVEADLANARDEVMYEDPLGAFSVRALEYDTTRILTYYEVELRIIYSRTLLEVNSLREVTGLAGVRQELARLVEEQRGSALFLASYFSGDQALVEDLVRLAGYSAPALYRHHEIRQISVSLYPETGTRRVIEVKLSWNQSAETVAEEEKNYAQRLETAVSALLEANPPPGTGTPWRSWPPSSAPPPGPGRRAAAVWLWTFCPGSPPLTWGSSWPWSTCASNAAWRRSRCLVHPICGSLCPLRAGTATCCPRACVLWRRKTRKTAASRLSRNRFCTQTRTSASWATPGRRPSTPPARTTPLRGRSRDSPWSHRNLCS